MAELLLDKGYIVHGLSRNAASCSSPNLASLMAVGEAVKALSLALLYTDVIRLFGHKCDISLAIAGAGRLFLHSCDVLDHTSVCSLLR